MGEFGQLGNQEEPFALYRKGWRSRGCNSITMKSRVRRESQARFCEGLEVRFLRATRQQLVEETLTVKRQTRSMPMFGFILGMVLSCYVGFSRLNHLRFLKREPTLTGILRVAELPPQSTFWRFLASLHLGVAQQLLQVQWRMRERVWK